jgi:hypothetical protein
LDTHACQFRQCCRGWQLGSRRSAQLAGHTDCNLAPAMKTLILSSSLAFALLAGCSKKSKCEEIFDHTMSLVPAELSDKLKDTKDAAIGKCEKLSDEAKDCALKAASMADLSSCPHH